MLRMATRNKKNIIMTSHKRHSVSNLWQLEWLFNSQFRLTTTKQKRESTGHLWVSNAQSANKRNKIKAPRIFVRGIHCWPVDSPTRASNAENVSIRWRHHEQVSPWGRIIDGFSKEIQVRWNFFLLSTRFWLLDRYKILQMARRLCCCGMAKSLLRNEDH